MKKFFVVGLVLFALTGLAAAQNPDDPGNTSDDVQPVIELPSTASPVAKNVADAINKFIAGSVDDLGGVLSGFLGNGSASNLTET